jgi:DNA-binding MarR family transcriptional regulator
MPDPTPVSALPSHLGYWLRSVSNHVSHAFARKLEAEGVTVAEWAFLRVLYDEEALAPGRLATRMGLTRGAISKLADRLIAKQLVDRTGRSDDARAQLLALSSAGRTIVPRLAELADRNDQEFFGHLTADERATVEAILKRIVQVQSLGGIPLS